MKHNEKKCPQCAEIIKVDARVCKHCGHEFSEDELNAHIAKAKQGKAIGCGVAIVLLLLVSFCVSRLPSPSTDNSTTSGLSTLVSGNSTATGEGAPASKWTYSQDKDAMRGTTTRYASLDSDNSAEFDFPYQGGSTATLQVRQRPEDGLRILLSVTKGQFLCNSFTNTTVSVKFDNGPVKKFGCSDTAAGNTDVIFIENPSTFLKALRASKSAMIEPQFFQAGGRQFTFDTSGLEWK
jgi:hypothetical protein